MNTAKHTPGPWEWQRGERFLKLGQRNAPHESVIPPCDRVRGSQVLTPNQANLRLIAAAPAMYEALKALVDIFPSVVKMIPYGVSMDISKLHDKAKAALAQAEGR